MDRLTWIVLFWIAAGLIFYVLVGYQVLLLVLDKLCGRRRKGAGDGELPQVSLIIPSYNEEVVLQGKLENALSMDYPREQLEILVASDGSDDATNEIAREFEGQGVRLLDFSPRRGKASVLNDATQLAAHGILCLCDANVMFRPGALKTLIQHFADKKVGAVTGDVRLASHESNFGTGESFYYRLERSIQIAESNLGSLMGVDGGMYVIRKSLCKQVPPDTILDDFVISMEVVRQGYRVVYEPRARADENGTPTARQEYRRRKRVAAGAAQSLKRGIWPPMTRPVEMWQYVSHKALRWLMPLWLILLLVANIALWRQGWFYQATLVAQLACYALAAVGALMTPARQLRAVGVPFYFMLSQLAVTHGMLSGLFQRQQGTWQRTERSGPGAVQSSKTVVR